MAQITTHSENCSKLTKESEQLRLEAYLCPAGVWTIGWGHTGYDVKQGLKITQEQAQKLLNEDLHFKDMFVAKLDLNWNQNQFDAIVDLVFNIGGGNFKTSTLLKLAKANVNDSAIADQFRRWVFGGNGMHNGKDDDGDGQVDEAGEKLKLPGLVVRNEKRIKLYFS